MELDVDQLSDSGEVDSGHIKSGGKSFPAVVALGVVITAYCIWFGEQSIHLVNTYNAPPFDMAIFDQGLWLLSHGRVPFDTLIGRNLFGDHTSFILVPVALVYRLMPEPAGILVLQTVVLASACIPVYILARKLLKSSMMALVLASAFLLNPILERGNLDQFHPEAFQVLIVSVALYAALERRYRLLVMMAVFALLVKEDAAALVIPLGMWVACKRNTRVGVTVIILGLAAAVLNNLVVIPAILGSNTFYTRRIPFGGVSGFMSAIVHRPFRVLHYFVSGGRPWYVYRVFVTVAMIGLVAIDVSAIGFGVIAENLLSGDSNMHLIQFQYSQPLVPIVVMAAVVAIGRQRKIRDRRLLVGEVLAASVITCVFWGGAPFSLGTGAAPVLSNGDIRAVNELTSMVPPAAAVSAWFSVTTHLDHRPNIYLWPNPFAADAWGLLRHSNVALPSASKVEFILLPTKLGSEDFPRLFRKIAPQFVRIAHRGHFSLYQRVEVGTS